MPIVRVLLLVCKLHKGQVENKDSRRRCICFLDQEIHCIRHKYLISNNKFLHGIHNTYFANCCGGDWGSSYRDISSSLKLVSSSDECNTGSIAVVEKL